MNQVQLEKISVLTQAIVRDVDSLPHFPETILELDPPHRGSPRHAWPRSPGRIATDPTLTADLLKLVNSAHYMLPRRVNNILQGVKIVGMKGLRNLLYSYGAQKILGEKYAEMKTLWEHSYRTAFYAFLLARSFKPKADILDDVYVAGHPARPGADHRHLPAPRGHGADGAVLQGQGHPAAHPGALLLRPEPCRHRGAHRPKWNFPEQLVHGIKHHHEPLMTPVQYKDIVFCVYLANALCDLERELITFEQMERPVLRDFGIRNEEQCRSILGAAAEIVRAAQAALRERF